MESSISNKIKTTGTGTGTGTGTKYNWDALLKDIEFKYIGNHHIFSRELCAFYVWNMALGVTISARREDLKFLEFAPSKVKRSLMQYLESKIKFPYSDTDAFLRKAGVIQDA